MGQTVRVMSLISRGNGYFCREITKENMSEKGTYSYEIIQRDVDFTNACTHTSLLNHILQAAGDDADLNGFGINDLNVGNCSWVISRMCTVFGRRPRQGETIKVRTWVSEVGRLMTTRHMEVTDCGGEVIARTVTQWAVIDMDTRRAVDIREHVDYRGAISDEPLSIDLPSRIPKVNSLAVAEKAVAYSDTDFNRHMNATKYLEWAIDHLPVEELVSGKMKRMDINFLKESLLGQRLTLHYTQEGGYHRYEIREASSGEALCRCSFRFS